MPCPHVRLVKLYPRDHLWKSEYLEKTRTCFPEAVCEPSCVLSWVCPLLRGPAPKRSRRLKKMPGGSPGGRSEPVMAIVRGQLASSQAKLPRETCPPGDLADAPPAGD